MFVGISLLVFCWGFLRLCSPVIWPYNFLFRAIFIGFWYQGDGLSSVIFWKHFRRIEVSSSLNGWQDSPVKPFGYVLLFVGSFIITVSVSVFVIGLFIFSLSYWFSLGSLYLSKNLFISSIFYQHIVACITLLWSFVFCGFYFNCSLFPSNFADLCSHFSWRVWLKVYPFCLCFQWACF